MKLSFPTRKLKGSIRKAGAKVAKLDIDPAQYTVFGVSKVNGVSVTGKDIGKNLGGYYFFEGQKFAYNPYRINIGSIGLSDESFVGLMSSAYVIFETDESINDEFLLLYLKSTLGINLIKWYGDRGGVRSALRFSDLEKIDFPKLSYNQQTQALVNIRTKQDIVDCLYFELNKQQSLIIKLRQSILQEAIEGKLTSKWRKANPNVEPASELVKRLKAEKDQLITNKKKKKEKTFSDIGKDKTPFRLPDTWDWCRLGEVSFIKSGVTLGKRYKTKTKEYKYLRVANVQRGFLKLNEVKTISIPESDAQKILLEEKDLLIIEGNGDIKAIGRCAIWNNEIENCIHQNHVIRIRFNENSIGEYVLSFINSPNSSKRIQELAITSTGLYTLSVGKLKPLLLAFPPLEEQRAIVSRVKKLMSLCDQLEQQISQSKTQAEQLMQAILQEAFTPKENKTDIIRELLPDIDKYAQVAMATLKIKNELKCNYGKVEKQKTGFLLQAVKKQPIPYTFEKQHFGTFSWELSNDLDTNPYLRKTKAGQGEVYEVKANKHQEVLDLLNKTKNASFVQALDELIQVYKMPLINAKTDQIELLNTVCKSILDTQSTELDTIYGYMEFWTIKQEGFNTKTEKFSRPETEKMLQLILKLEWEKELISK